jgi:hypothetical protein
VEIKMRKSRPIAEVDVIDGVSDGPPTSESVPARAVPVEEEGPVGGQSGVPPRAIEEPEASTPKRAPLKAIPVDE